VARQEPQALDRCSGEIRQALERHRQLRVPGARLELRAGRGAVCGRRRGEVSR
jgi:hypothetical protein